MGFFGKLKEMFETKDYMVMTPEELLELDDAELSIAILERDFSGRYEETVAEMLTELSGAVRVYYILDTYDMLATIGKKRSDYCLEKDKDLFPVLLSTLEEVGAQQNKYLVEDFVAKYNLDLDNLNEEDFEKLRMKNENKKSPIDEFKDAYGEILGQENELDRCLMAYIRQHIEEI